MIEIATLITVAVASFFIVIVPGPSVTVIIANSLRAGARAGLLNVAGTQFGVFTMILIVAAGLETVVAVMGEAFFWVKLAGAAYLIWLGIKLLRSNGATLGVDKNVPPPKIGYFWQGFFVLWSNPKALFFFGAFIPQFVDLSRDTFWQTMALGMVFLVVAAIFDSLYALMAGGAGSMLSSRKVRIAEIGSGFCLVGGGVWLATAGLERR